MFRNLQYLCLLLIALGANAQGPIQHIEPLNWWVGMKSPLLQLMVHETGISSYQPKINHKGVTIKKVHRTNNPNYLFIDLHISPNTQAGEMDILFEQSGRKPIHQSYSLLERTPHSAQREGFSAKDVIYLITPDRFANGNQQNDQISGLSDTLDRTAMYARHGGDIAGIIDHLDYIEKLGVTALWINPLLENNMPTYSYHGYAITDFSKTDPRFGTNEDYKRLSLLAKERNIKLIADMVANHCGLEHWWMKDLPDSNWVNYQNQPVTITNHRREALHDAYASASDIKLQSDGWFVPTMPDLNQRNPYLAQYLIQNAIWWVEYADLGGIRMDTYPYPDKEFMAEWSQRIMAEYPDFNIVGEEWSYNPSLVANWQRGVKNKDGYRSNLKSLMDFPLNEALIKAFNEEESWGEGLIRLYQTLANDYVYAQPNDLVTFTDNHDMSRIFTQLKENSDHLKQALVFLMTTRGIPQLYYGTEILMSNPNSEEHGEIRGDMPGGWQGDSISVFNQTGLTDAQADLLHFTRKLLNWRKSASAVHQGKLMHFAPENGVYVQVRYNAQQKIMVILNKNKEPYQLDLQRFKEIIPNQFTARNILEDTTIHVKKSVMLQAGKAMILEF
ncbi:glycoside hydrolase family 13 protein [Dyadobacter tibetensis]|uniref:glycoside hydrolase family 13 protein n=1 Tax=Dyadobacter tibetensis TaxID=1211851 RepID=UPI00046FC150|nr:glycoside hydrolase family 13 protein [Dyadobacter tibetensis]